MILILQQLVEQPNVKWGAHLGAQLTPYLFSVGPLLGLGFEPYSHHSQI